ncbi:PilZ domain-containing protein [Thermodesulfobacteriota bacterium B35]
MTEKRRFARVLFERTVRFSLHGVAYAGMKIRDLSIGGLFVRGDFPDARPGDRFRLELHETGRHSCLILHFGARIVRVEEDGIGLRFTDMTEDAYRFLQTMVLYYTEDPYGVAREFLEDFPGSSSAGT